MEARSCPAVRAWRGPDITGRGHSQAVPGGRGPASWSPQRLTARGLYPRFRWGQEAPDEPLQLPAHKSPPGSARRPRLPRNPFHPAGPRSSGQTTSGSDAAIPPPTKESGHREGRTRGRGRAWAPEPRLVPRQPRRQTQPFSGWAPLVGEPGCGRVAGGGAALTGGPPVPGAGALLPPRAGRAEPRARPSHAGLSRPSAAGPQTPASTFPGTSWACDPPRGSAGGRSSTWGSARRHLLGSREH